MIKIKFKNPAAAEAKYLKMVNPGVVSRLKVFKKTLDDINGGATHVTGDNIDSYQVTTRELINLVADPELSKDKFHAANYVKTVDDYVADPNNKLGNLQLTGLAKLIDDLLDAKTKLLDSLLICPVTGLAKLNKALLKKYKLSTSTDISSIKLAFNYSDYKEIAKEIKAFFREENIVNYCPYCNMLEADYSEDEAGKPATIHFLDHFFDKATNPLLSYSMYNLVPCDGMCNGSTIKHTAKFDDTYHLSPYERGFDKKLMVFEPILGTVSNPLKAINLKVIPKHGSAEYRRLVGDDKTITERTKKGNINAFKLKSRYNRPHILKQNGAKVQKLLQHITTRDSLKSFLKNMNFQQNADNYKKWYFGEFYTEFEEEKFHENSFSKLIRDMHDHIVLGSDAKNDDIKVFIK